MDDLLDFAPLPVREKESQISTSVKDAEFAFRILAEGADGDVE